MDFFSTKFLHVMNGENMAEKGNPHIILKKIRVGSKQNRDGRTLVNTNDFFLPYDL